MQQFNQFHLPARRSLLVLLSAVALAVFGCDNDVNFNPTTPTFPDFTPLDAGRSLEISGRLTTAQGSCLEATVLYDGVEVVGARTQCPNPGGCNELELTAVASTQPGHHTISFQVLRQSPGVVSYSADGRVHSSRGGLSMAFTIPLEPKRATLRSGESVDYDLQFWN